MTAIYRILRDLTLLFAPVIPFTSEEIWSSSSLEKGMDKTAPASRCPPPTPVRVEAFMAKWNRIHALRDDVNKALSWPVPPRSSARGLEAKVILSCEGAPWILLVVSGDLAHGVYRLPGGDQRGAEGDFAGDVAGLKVTVAKADALEVRALLDLQRHRRPVRRASHLCARCAKVLGKVIQIRSSCGASAVVCRNLALAATPTKYKPPQGGIGVNP